MTPVDVVDRQVDAYNRHDLDGFIACYAADAVIRGADGAVLAEGHERLRSVYGPLFEHHRPTARIVSRIVAGEWVIDHERVTAEGRDPLEAAAAYLLRDGLIARVILLM